MKKLSVFTLIAFALFLSGWAGVAKAHEEGAPHDEAAEATGMVKVYQCPMDGYTVSAKCPLCGAKMEEKEMTAADAQAAIDKSKDKMRNRS